MKNLCNASVWNKGFELGDGRRVVRQDWIVEKEHVMDLGFSITVRAKEVYRIIGDTEYHGYGTWRAP